MPGREIVVGVSGASGALLARRFVELALADPNLSRLHLVLSDSSLRVARTEIAASIRSAADWVQALTVPSKAAGKIELHGAEQVSRGAFARRNDGAPVEAGPDRFAGGDAARRTSTAFRRAA